MRSLIEPNRTKPGQELFCVIKQIKKIRSVELPNLNNK